MKRTTKTKFVKSAHKKEKENEWKKKVWVREGIDSSSWNRCRPWTMAGSQVYFRCPGNFVSNPKFIFSSLLLWISNSGIWSSESLICRCKFHSKIRILGNVPVAKEILDNLRLEIDNPVRTVFQIFYWLNNRLLRGNDRHFWYLLIRQLHNGVEMSTPSNSTIFPPLS